MMAQPALAWSDVPQVGLMEKSALLVPPSVMLVILSVAVPVLVKVTLWRALVVFTAWSGKITLFAVRVAKGATPVPVRLTI